jgi:hypothetical protein
MAFLFAATDRCYGFYISLNGIKNNVGFGAAVNPELKNNIGSIDRLIDELGPDAYCRSLYQLFGFKGKYTAFIDAYRTTDFGVVLNPSEACKVDLKESCKEALRIGSSVRSSRWKGVARINQTMSVRLNDTWLKGDGKKYKTTVDDMGIRSDEFKDRLMLSGLKSDIIAFRMIEKPGACFYGANLNSCEYQVGNGVLLGARSVGDAIADTKVKFTTDNSQIDFVETPRRFAEMCALVVQSYQPWSDLRKIKNAALATIKNKKDVSFTFGKFDVFLSAAPAGWKGSYSKWPEETDFYFECLIQPSFQPE